MSPGREAGAFSFLYKVGMLWLLPLAALAAAAPPAGPVPVQLTTYATPSERDFGDDLTEKVQWKSPLDHKIHESLFVAGFAGRDSVDPVLPGVSGAAMEGAGLIDPMLHALDPDLGPMIRLGYRFLTLDSWNERARRAYFSLAKSPLAADGHSLAPGVSAAVRPRNKLFPRGRLVRLVCGGKPIGDRLIHDTCSSCKDDRHIDLYVAASTTTVDFPADCTAELLPRK